MMHEFLSHTKPLHTVVNPKMETVPTILTTLKITSSTLLKNLRRMHLCLVGRNMSTDRLYTSVSLANWLLERGITTVGILNTNRIRISDEIKQKKDSEEFSATCHVDSSGNLYLTSYAVRTESKGKKNVLVLSTMRPLPGATRDDGYHKPAIINLYEFTNGLPRMTLERLVKKFRLPHKQMEKESNILTHTRMKGDGASSVKKVVASRRSPIYRRQRKTVSHAG